MRQSSGDPMVCAIIIEPDSRAAPDLPKLLFPLAPPPGKIGLI
jgi:hypothetical protein